MIQTLSTALVGAMPAGADAAEKMMDVEPALAAGPPFRRLFLDAMVVEESGGLERVFHPATKYEGNPVIVKDRDWEGWGPCGICTVRDGDRLRMYYFCIVPKVYHTCVAESEDGIHWTKPIVGDVEWNGSKENNIVTVTGQVMRLAHPPSPDKTWICITNKNIAYSPDGYHWKREERAEELFSSSDVVSFFFDPYHNRLAATWKCASRRLRSAGVVWSEDLEHWVKPVEGAVMVADDLDPDATQIYGMPVFAYQGMYIGHPWLYHARIWKHGGYSPARMYEAQEGSIRTMDTHIAWSWDLINWTRTPKREPFIAVSPHYSYECGMVNTNVDVIVMGDEIWFYYTGCDQVHDEDAGTNAVMCLAKLRMDGFCSMRAGDEEGWFISRREVFNTPKITINAKCRPGGYIAAELLDRHNDVIPGFEWYYSNAFTGDSVRGELTWAKHPTFPGECIDKDKKIRFRIKKADLFSYLPENINREIDDGWPD